MIQYTQQHVSENRILPKLLAVKVNSRPSPLLPGALAVHASFYIDKNLSRYWKSIPGSASVIGGR